jgi:hypothetical protein
MLDTGMNGLCTCNVLLGLCCTPVLYTHLSAVCHVSRRMSAWCGTSAKQRWATSLVSLSKNLMKSMVWCCLTAGCYMCSWCLLNNVEDYMYNGVGRVLGTRVTASCAAAMRCWAC